MASGERKPAWKHALEPCSGSVTPSNVHDGRAGGAVVPDVPGVLYADSAYCGTRFAEATVAAGRRLRTGFSCCACTVGTNAAILSNDR